MAIMNTPGTTPAELRSFVERIQNLETQIKELNADKSDVYQEAKGKGFDVAAIKAVVAYLRKDATARAEQRQLFELYLGHVIGTPIATRAYAIQASKSAAAALTKQAANIQQTAGTTASNDPRAQSIPAVRPSSPSASPATVPEHTSPSPGAAAPCEQSGALTAPGNSQSAIPSGDDPYNRIPSDLQRPFPNEARA